MKKDLAYVCDYLKALVIPDMPDGFVVAEPFRHGLTDDELRKGMSAFRDFLYAMFEMVSENKDRIDVERGSKYDPFGSQSDRGSGNIKECFPVFNDLTMILLHLGYHGRLEAKPEMRLTVSGEEILAVICPITEKYQSFIKMGTDRKREMFNLLSDLGLRFDGADFSWDVDFTKIGRFHVTSSINVFFPVGLKLIAESVTNNKEYYKLENLLGSVIRRGDFYPLANGSPKKYMSNIEEYASAQHPDVREWIVKLNAFLMRKGCKMIQGMGGGSPFTYIKRNTNVTQGMVCIIEMGITGCAVIPGINHLSKPFGIMDMLPDEMADIIINRDGRVFNENQCFRQKGNMGFSRFTFTYKGNEYISCRHAGRSCRFSGTKCRFTGFRFGLSDPNIRDLMMKWIELELTADDRGIPLCWD